MDLSIIIPVYNTEENALARCFASVSRFDDFSHEVIIVDDGSNEETAEFCREYARKHAPFRYFGQQNKGVSAARNEGLRQAQGKYILFVDADDELIPNSLKRNHLDTNAQIIFYNYEAMESGRRKKWSLFHQRPNAVLDKKIIFAAACQNRLNSVWSKLFLRSFLIENAIFLDETMVFAEDAVFVLQAVSAADCAYYVDMVLYRYHHNFSTSNRRIIRFPEKVIGNSVMLYTTRREILNNPKIQALYTNREMQALDTAIRDRVVRDIFEAFGSLYIMGRYQQHMYQKVYLLIKEMYEEHLDAFSVVTKLKCLFLVRNWKLAMIICAYLREIYIRVRH